MSIKPPVLKLEAILGDLALLRANDVNLSDSSTKQHEAASVSKAVEFISQGRAIVKLGGVVSDSKDLEDLERVRNVLEGVESALSKET